MNSDLKKNYKMNHAVFIVCYIKKAKLVVIKRLNFNYNIYTKYKILLTMQCTILFYTSVWNSFKIIIQM